jgi:hypothetical protein
MATQTAKGKVKIVDAAYQQSSAEVTRILAAMTAFNEAARAEKDVFAALQKSYEFHQQQANEHAERRHELYEESNRLQLEYGRQAIADLATLTDVSADAIVAIRIELEISETAGEATERMRARLARAQELLLPAFDETMSALERATQKSS